MPVRAQAQLTTQARRTLARTVQWPGCAQAQVGSCCAAPRPVLLCPHSHLGDKSSAVAGDARPVIIAWVGSRHPVGQNRLSVGEAGLEGQQQLGVGGIGACAAAARAAVWQAGDGLQHLIDQPCCFAEVGCAAGAARARQSREFSCGSSIKVYVGWHGRDLHVGVGRWACWGEGEGEDGICCSPPCQ